MLDALDEKTRAHFDRASDASRSRGMLYRQRKEERTIALPGGN